MSELSTLRRIAVIALFAACAGADADDPDRASGPEAASDAASGADAPATARTDDQETPPNTLSAEEREQGFVLLFDGRSLDAWRGFRREDVPAGWKAVDGTLHFEPGIEGGDLVTRETFGDFELRLQWKISPGGNSGIMYRVSETTERTYESGPEMQVLDDTGHVDGGNPLTSAGAAYGLYAADGAGPRPVGEWNDVRIVARGARVEHWLNGVKVVEYELGSADWRERVAGSKFAEWPQYGTIESGHIALQDHGDPVWYRDLRIRRLDG